MGTIPQWIIDARKAKKKRLSQKARSLFNRGVHEDDAKKARAADKAYRRSVRGANQSRTKKKHGRQ